MLVKALTARLALERVSKIASTFSLEKFKEARILLIAPFDKTVTTLFKLLFLKPEGDSFSDLGFCNDKIGLIDKRKRVESCKPNYQNL